MVEVYFIYSGQPARTFVPGGPFVDSQAAHQALADFANQHHGSWKQMIAVIDEYGFVVKGAGTVQVRTKP